MLLICNCETKLDHLDIQYNNLRQPNDSTIVYMTVNSDFDFGFHIEVYYSINEIYTLTNGYFDTHAYKVYHDGKMVDYEYPDHEIEEAMKSLPYIDESKFL